MQRAALLSVSDKSNLEIIASALTKAGYLLLSSSGTANKLEELGFSVTRVEEYTGQKEILGGRVKTLHPKIHAGLLAKRCDVSHMQELEDAGMYQIDVTVVNLYPFLDKVKTEAASDPGTMIEFIDIGGPAMIRASAKNMNSVLALSDPADYEQAASYIATGDIPHSFRVACAAKVFAQMANYNLEIARYFSSQSSPDSENQFPTYAGLVLEQEQPLRYGENPHQSAALYRCISQKEKSWKQHAGKVLSYNNMLDFDASLSMILSFKEARPTTVIVKHLNPCGVGSAQTLSSSLELARCGDPRSHFGGIVAFNKEVDLETAEQLKEAFVEIVLAPKYQAAALESLTKRKNLRIIEVDFAACGLEHELRVVEGAALLQERDPGASGVADAKVVSKRAPTEQELQALEFNWKVCAHVKSNAIVVGTESTVLAVGGGQMSRIDSAELAVAKAQTHGHNLTGTVAASDAFFPFPDALEILIEKGVSAVITPGGASKDEQVIAAADKAGIALLFAKTRHFRH